MMKALDLLLDWTDRLLQLVIPPVANRITYVSFPDYSDNAFYVFRHALLTRHGLEHVWLVRDLALRERIEREYRAAVRSAATTGNTLRVVQRTSVRGYWLFLRSRFVFHTHAAYRFRSWAWRRTVACLWHGMPIKCIGLLNRISPNPYPTFGTLHLATSAFFREIIAASFGVPEHKVTLCNLPRCDALQIPAAVRVARERVREVLGLQAGQHLILWMPTYRTDATRGADPGARSFLDDLRPGLLNALEAAAARAGAVVIAKLHPWDSLNERALSWPWTHVRLLRAPEWSAHGIQLYDLIAASDALISDVSSVLIDYLVTGLPAGILGFDTSTYTRELNFPLSRLLETGRFEVLDDTAAIERLVARAGTRQTPEPSFLYDTFSTPGSEHVLAKVGL